MRQILDYILEKSSSFNVYIMVGLPGSGKSTYIKDNLSSNIEIVNQDSIRVKLGIMKDINQKRIGNEEQEKEVTRINDKRIEQLIKDRKNFVIDNTNIKVGKIDHYLDLLKHTNANIKIIIIDTPIEVCKERRKEDIPEKVFDDMKIGLDKVKSKYKDNKYTKIIK